MENIKLKSIFKLQWRLQTSLLAGLITILFVSGCASKTSQPDLADEIILYNWESDLPQSVLDDFTGEFGVRIRYESYESQEQAIENLRAGSSYDVIVMESRFIPMLANEGLLNEFEYENIINFKNISPSFRDLAYDPGNRYSIPYTWGVTGLVVRTDRTEKPVTQWADLWDEQYVGKTAIWVGQPRETIALTLKSLGYSANSENPLELEAALKQLIALKPGLHYVEDYSAESAAYALDTSEVTIAMGYAGDFSASKEFGQQVDFVMPQEGALLWGDTFIVPASSQNKYTAELFINFLLRPEVSAEIVNEKHYASANSSASPFIESAILKNKAIYPSDEVLKRAEIILPLSAEGQRLYDMIWQEFLEAEPQK